MSRVIRIAALLTVVTAVGGCVSRDPYNRTDVWRPTGANSANLAAMVADPRDLLRGHGTTRQSTKASAVAAERLWVDQPKSLPTASGGGGGGGGSPPGG